VQTAGVTERPGVRNVRLVARRELLIRLRSRAFLLSTLLLVGVALVLGAVPLGVRLLEREAVSRIAVVAPDAALGEIARGSLDLVLNGANRLDPTSRNPFEVSVVPDEAAARSAVDAGELDGALVVRRDPDGTLSFVYLTNAPRGRTAILARLGAVAIAVGDMVGRAQGLIGEFEVVPIDPSASARPTETEQTSARILAYVLVVLLFFISVSYGMWVAASVVEEKATRVIELVLGAATPAQLLAGKVAGIGLAGLIQMSAIVVPLLGVLLLQDQLAALVLGGEATISRLLGGLGVGVLAGFVVLGILGFLLSAFLYAAAGSLVWRQEDVQQVSLPMLALTMAGYIAAAIAVGSVDAAWVAPLSLLPFFSPYLLLVRLMLDTVALWEIAVAVGLLAASIALAAGLASRVYAAGVLLHGQRPSFGALVAVVLGRR